MRICSVLNCDRKHKANGYCGRHIQQIYKYGKIVSSGRSKTDPNEIIVINDIAHMKLYDMNGNYLEETIFDIRFISTISVYKWYYSRETKYVSSSWVDEDGVRKQMLLHRFLIE